MSAAATKIDFNPANVVQLPEAVESYVRRMIANQQLYTDDEKRTQKRFELAARTLLVPVNENFEPIGPAIEALARNISAGGIAVVHTRAVGDRFFAVQVSMPSRQELKMIAEVLRCRPNGRFYDIGMKFVAKIE